MTHQATRNKKKGARWETTLLGWLQANGFPRADRLHLSGTADIGDITLVDADGDRHCIEAKDCAQWSLGVWWAEVEREAENRGDLNKMLVIRRRGSTDPGTAWVVTTLDEWAKEHAPRPVHTYPGLTDISGFVNAWTARSKELRLDDDRP